MAYRTVQESNLEEILLKEASLCGWDYKPASEIERPLENVLVESWLNTKFLAAR